MHQLSESLEQISVTLKTLRQNPKTRHRYPKEFWDSVFQLAKSLPLNKICQYLALDMAHAKNKMNQTQEKTLDFREFSFSSDLSGVVIELSFGHVNAKIHGPISCIDRLFILLGK